MSNFHVFKDLKLAKYFKPDKIPHEIKQFSYLVTEATFLIRSLFFVLFGFMIDLNNLLDFNTLPWSLSITGLLFVLRLIFLKLTQQSILPQLFIAPRGLITILLFLSIPTNFKINLVNQSLVIQVILLSIFLMMLGIISHREEKAQPEN